MKPIATFLTLLFICNIATAGTRDPATPDERHVSYGEKFSHVLKIRTRRAADSKQQYASAVLVAANWVITAAHVVEGTDDWAVIHEGVEVPITSMVIHRDYDDNKVGSNDLAMGRLETNIARDWYPGLHQGSEEVGKMASIAGFGLTGTFASGCVISDGKRRAGSNFIDRVERGMLVCGISGKRKTSLEFLISPGDSGGGLFIGNELAGINSLIMRDGRGPLRSGYGEESGHTRVSMHREWIMETMRCEE